jgi:hypothetical protein
MRKISKHEMPVTWVYWLCVSLFLVLFCGAIMLLFANDGKDRGMGFMGCFAFFAFGVGGLLFPILRRRELQGVKTEWIRSADIHCEALLFPCSSVRQYIVLFGSLLLAVGVGGLAFWADTVENRIKDAMASAALVCLFVLGIKSSLKGRLGILLVPQGIVWREMFRSPYYVPWEIVTKAGLFLKKEPPVSRPLLAFGLIIKDPSLVRTTSESRKNLVESWNKTGWHLYFCAETVLEPLSVVAAAVNFYLANPGARRELGTSADLARVLDMEAALPPDTTETGAKSFYTAE